MRRPTLSLTLCITLLASASPIAAQTACAPEAPMKAADVFAHEPFGARSWRMLNGLGDPGLAAESSSYDGWAKADEWRKRTAELAPEMLGLQKIAYNCRMGYALETLNARVGQLGATDPYIKQWLNAQDKVLRACDDQASEPTVLPQPLEVKSELAQLQIDDRAYQEASVAFYRDKPKAVQMFRDIAATQSPHRAAARYNIANLLANANNVVEARTEAASILADPALASVHPITKELQGYIANLEDTAQGWTELLDNTIETLSQPSSSVTDKARFAAALYDIEYAGVRAKRDDWWIAAKLPENPTLSKAIVDASRKHPMALWMMAGQSVNEPFGKAPWALVGPTWSAWATSYVDRALAIEPASKGITGPALDVLVAQKSGSDDQSRALLWGKAKAAVAATQSSCGTAPETGAVSELLLQATRVSAQAGKYDEIYDALSALPPGGDVTVGDVILPRLMEHLLATGNAAEGRKLRDRFLTTSLLAAMPTDSRELRVQTYADFMAWVAESEEKFVNALALSNQKLASPLLNFVSAKTMRRLADSSAFPPDQAALLSRAAWTRDYARGRSVKAADEARMLELNPDIKTAFEKVKTEFPKLATQRQWLLTVLRNPRFGILVNSPDWTDAIEAKREKFAAIDPYDHNDKNWWCPLQTDRHLLHARTLLDAASSLDRVIGYRSDQVKLLVEQPAFDALVAARDNLLKAHPLLKDANWAELNELAKASSAPKRLSQSATKWGRASKGTDGAPEALALAQQAVRYGCNWNGGHKAYSKPVQELLQTKFASTGWAKSSPYWYDCLRQEWDKDYNKITTCDVRTWPKQLPLR